MMKNLTVPEVYSKTLQDIPLGIHQNHIYKRQNDNWHRILPKELALQIRRLYPKDERLRISVACIKEVTERLIQEPDIQLNFTEDTYENFIKLNSSVFDVETGKNIYDFNGDFGYSLAFDYIEPKQRTYPYFLAFTRSIFPTETEEKTKLLLEIMSYCISDYQTAKAAFFFLGESNSGKSTILELLTKLLPEHAVTSVPLYRLHNRFNMAKLADSRINICHEITEDSLSSSDIFKMLTANEMVTAEHKGQAPFEFRLRCKSLNAGNVIPEIKNGMGINAILNRMVILTFPVSIPKDKQDLELLNKLWSERDSIFSEALDKLVELKNRNFRFTEPRDSVIFKNNLNKQINYVEHFIAERCIYEPESKVHLTRLYEALRAYCDENLIEMKTSKNQFSQEICKKSGITHCKFRLNGGPPLAGVKGIRLKEVEEYHSQDSDVYSQSNLGKFVFRNDGTLEQKKEIIDNEK